jgi:exopolyphosphatase/guanosine-5'-triphosphate,3'-diphosphate pyrophosphatase
MKVDKYAGIDIGSNGVRLLIMNIYEKDGQRIYNKNMLVRAPIRLGSDSFVHNEIKEDTLNKLVLAMQSFKNLMDIYGVSKYKACATSAIREAQNNQEVVSHVFEKSGILIEIIDGKEEADIIYQTQINDFLKNDEAYLFIDVGGGSTEITYYNNKKRVQSKSFKIGTVRALKQLVSKTEWEEVYEFIKELKIKEGTFAVGTGGNINTLFKNSRKPLGSLLSYNYIKEQHKILNELTVDERIIEFGFNPDRADVIVPALDIYLNIMKKGGLKQILVPKIGLADGIVKSL